MLLNEIFWKKKYEVKFKNYQIVEMNWFPEKHGGRVIILIHSSIQFKELEPSMNLETVTVSIISSNHEEMDIVAAYNAMARKTKNEWRVDPLSIEMRYKW